MAEEAYTNYDANETTGLTIYINKRVQYSKSIKLFLYNVVSLTHFVIFAEVL